MSDTLSPAEIERRARDAGASIAAICRAADVAHTTFGRWKRGETKPTLGVYERICQALAEAERGKSL